MYTHICVYTEKGCNSPGTLEKRSGICETTRFRSKLRSKFFDDPNAIFAENYFVEGEQRVQVIGMTESLLLLLVVFVDLTESAEIHYRIISARKAEAVEESAYEDQIS